MLRATFVTGLTFVIKSYPASAHCNIQNCPIGFVFLEDSDAETFCNTVKSNKDVMACKLINIHKSGLVLFLK